MIFRCNLLASRRISGENSAATLRPASAPKRDRHASIGVTDVIEVCRHTEIVRSHFVGAAASGDVGRLYPAGVGLVDEAVD